MPSCAGGSNGWERKVSRVTELDRHDSGVAIREDKAKLQYGLSFCEVNGGCRMNDSL